MRITRCFASLAMTAISAYPRPSVTRSITAAKAVVVVERVVLDAAVVPQRQRAGLPAETAGEFGPRLVREEEVEQRRAFGLGHPGKAERVAALDIERLAAGLGMGAHDRVSATYAAARPRGAPSRMRSSRVLVTSALADELTADEAVEQAPQPRRQGLVGEIHVGEQRVAATRRHLAREQHRAHRRAFEIRGVGMPDAAEIDPLVAPA